MRVPVAMLMNKAQAGEALASKILGLHGCQYLPHVAAPSLLAQTELNPDTSGRINRQPVAFRRPKVYLFCRLDSCFIETVAQPAHHASHLYLARGEEDHLQHDV